MLERIKSFIDNLGSDHHGNSSSGSNVYIEFESNGCLPFNTASVKVKAFRDQSKAQRITNFTIEWFRQFEKRNYVIDNAEDSYNFSCEDLGSRIICLVTDNDSPSNSNFITFGPVLLDPQCRGELEHAFRAERAQYEVQLPYKRFGNDLLLRPPEYKDPENFVIDEVALTPNGINFIHETSVTETMPLAGLNFEIVLNHPLLVSVRLDDSKSPALGAFEVRKHFEKGHWLYIKFFSRVFKETFLMLARLFTEIKVQGYSNALSILEARGTEKGLFELRTPGILTAKVFSIGDLLLQKERLREALNRNVAFTKAIIEERDSLIEYGEVLERDLKATLKEMKSVHTAQKDSDQLIIHDLKPTEQSQSNIKEVKGGDNFEETPSNTSLLVRCDQLKAENQNLEKLNRELIKEVKGYREKRRAKIKSINQSLSAMNQKLALQAENLHNVSEHNSCSMNLSNYLDHMENKSSDHHPVTANIVQEIESKVPDTKIAMDGCTQTDEADTDIQELARLKLEAQRSQELATENQNLKNSVEAMRARLESLEEREKNLLVMADPFFENQFNALRTKIESLCLDPFSEDAVDSQGGFGALDKSFCEALGKAIKCNKMELLNVENAALREKISYITQQLKEQNPGDDGFNLSLSSLNGLQQRVDQLRSENLRLFDEFCALRNQAGSNEAALRDQIDSMSKERDQVLKENLEQKNQLQNVASYEQTIESLNAKILENERLLERATETNRALVEEIGRLQTNLASKDESTHASHLSS